MDNPRRQRPFARRSDADALDAHRVEALENGLRALPELEAPGELWERIQGRLDEDGDPKSLSPWRWGLKTPMAAAAGVALIAIAAVVSVHFDSRDSDPIGKPEVASDNAIGGPVDEPFDHTAVIEALMEQSRLAERRRRAVLAFYSPTAPERLLRAQIGGIDAALNEQMFAGEIEPKSREALLRDRVDLMANLTDIERYRQHEFVQQVSF